MAALEICAIDEATPQIRAPGTGDTYTAPRPLAITGVAGTSALSITGGTQTTDVNFLNLTGTWNAAGVTFTGIKANITDTASAAASLLMDLQVGGSSKFKVVKSGAIYSFGNATLADNSCYVNGSGVAVWNGGYFAFSSTSGASGTPDVYLTRDAANTLALRNGTNAQTFNIYNTTDGTNYERGFMRWASNVLEIGTEKAGTGTGRSIKLIAASHASNFVYIQNTLQLSAATLFECIINNTTVLSGLGAGTGGASGISITASDSNEFSGVGTRIGGNYYHQTIFGNRPGYNDTAQAAIYVTPGAVFATNVTNIVGAATYIKGGNGASSSTGNAHGGNVYFRGGTGYGTGHHGYLYIGDSNTGGISFYNATPVAQQSGTGETTGFTAGAGTAVKDDSTFTGNVGSTAYRISDIVKALKNYGLLAS